KRGRLREIDRVFFVWVFHLFSSGVDALFIVKPETVLRWRRRGFRAYLRWESWCRGGVPPKKLIRVRGRVGCGTGTRDVGVPDQASARGPMWNALAGETQG